MHKFFLDIILACISFFVFEIRSWENDSVHILSSILFVTSTILWVMARVQLGSSFAILPAARELIVTGLYRKIRHPIYCFSSLAFASVAVVAKEWYFYLGLFLLIIIQILRAKNEEGCLVQKFGWRYDAYKKTTWF